MLLPSFFTRQAPIPIQPLSHLPAIVISAPVTSYGRSRSSFSLVVHLHCNTTSHMRVSRIDYDLAPDTPEVIRMLNDLQGVYRTQQALSGVVGCSVLTLRNWITGKFHPEAPGVRAIWLLHCLHFAPWKLRTSFDLITWGRYAVRSKPDSGH